MKKKLLTLLAGGAAATALVAGPGIADAAANNNVVVVNTNSPNHQTGAQTAFQVNTNIGLVATDHNRAQASSQYCDGCHAVATAVQVSLASGPVVKVFGINRAIAYQYEAINSDTCASAYQFVIAPNRTVSFSAAGLAAIAQIKANVTAITASANDCDVITAAIGDQMDSLWVVLNDPATYVGLTASSTLARTAAPAGVQVMRYADVQTA